MPRAHESETAIALVDPLVGTIFDKRFHVDERIAAGGFGAIYRATHVKSGHQIALKVLLPALAQDLGVLARFRREGATLTALRCPHTITAYELGQAPDRTLFIVLELLHGTNLFERYQASGPMEWKRVVKIAREVCESLEEAHGLGIVHRDLKPTNINLEQYEDDPDYVKVLDFGIAKIVGGNSDIDASDITNAGQMIGTLEYMSPEQMVGGAVTGQTDIYTLGIVMYEVVAGCRPFPEATTAAAALAAMLKTTPQSLYLRAPVPQALDRVVMRCLERETHRRYQTVAELRADLERVLRDTPADVRTLELDVGARGVDDEDDATTVTPPPEKRAHSDDDDEHTATVVAPSLRVASSADVKTPRVERELDVKTPRVERELDVKTPRVEAELDLKTPRVEARHDSGVDAKTPRLDREAPPRAATITRPPPAPLTPPPRPLEARHLTTPLPQLVVAPFSTPRASAPTPFPPAPSSMFTVTPAPGRPSEFDTGRMAAREEFDMSRIAARETMVRRLVWVIALVVAAGAAIFVATML